MTVKDFSVWFMFYILTLILFIVLYYVFVKILSSIIKGCLVSGGIVFAIFVGYTLYKSTIAPVQIFGIWEVSNMKVVKIP